MPDWNPLHRDANWLERVSERAEMNSREIDLLRTLFWIGLITGICVGSGGTCLFLLLTR